MKEIKGNENNRRSGKSVGRHIKNAATGRSVDRNSYDEEILTFSVSDLEGDDWLKALTSEHIADTQDIARALSFTNDEPVSTNIQASPPVITLPDIEPAPSVSKPGFQLTAQEPVIIIEKTPPVTRVAARSKVSSDESAEQSSSREHSKASGRPVKKGKPAEAPLRNGAPVKEPKSGKKKRKKSTVLQSLPFLLTLLAITVSAWLLPLRPTFSASEKRDLATFPSFTVSALLSGDYFSDIEDWFADTFTFREYWIELGQQIDRLHGIQTVVIHVGAQEKNDDIPVVTPSPAPEATAAPVEASDAAVTPEPTPEPTPELIIAEVDENGIISMTEDEQAVWKGLVVGADEYVNSASVLQVGSSTFEFPSFSRSATEAYAGIINKVGTLLEGKARVWSIPVPVTATYMLSKEDREAIGLVIEEDAIDYLATLVTGNAAVINAVPELVAHNDEYLGFRTDHHWTARGAYYAYVAWCKEAGFEAVSLDEYEEGVLSPFYGAYYYNSSVNRSLLSADDVYTYTPPGDIHMYLNFSNNDRLGYEAESLILNIVTNDKYTAFLGSDEAQVTFINNDIDDDSAVVVYKTSYGNPFVYYLTQHYHTVHVIDIRNYAYRSVTKFVEEFNISDVIYLHSFVTAQSSSGVPALIDMLAK